MLKDKIVLITGASSGIGAACAKQFAQAGAKLLLCARRFELLHDLAEQLQEEHDADIHMFTVDVCKQAQVINAFNDLPTGWRNIDILINNAGLAAGLESIYEADVADWEKMIDTNVKGLLYVTRAVLPQMVERNFGHVINIGSIAGHQVYPKGAVYCATKHAVKALSEGLRQDLLGTKIRVSSVDPGAVETNFSLVRFKGDKERAAAVYEGMEPLSADDVADAVFYCATRPAHVNIHEMIILPTDQASATMISRHSSHKK
ncbi:SDR family oxidoreductase [Legionella nagasakiensis]|uniref:SDR family oxidoreductase n=1 Tax=Legionella nagasakiensis TaxID=535290 RepID=UPI0010555F3D|nr:SDR family oxidoreductase [Legionella nagasakiensis]